MHQFGKVELKRVLRGVVAGDGVLQPLAIGHDLLVLKGGRGIRRGRTRKGQDVLGQVGIKVGIRRTIGVIRGWCRTKAAHRLTSHRLVEHGTPIGQSRVVIKDESHPLLKCANGEFKLTGDDPGVRLRSTAGDRGDDSGHRIQGCGQI